MSQVKTNTDKELMLQIVGYNAEAFQQLFNRYSPNLLAIIKEIISNPKLAEKVLLNVFSVFLKRIDFFNTSSSNVFTYLTLLTRNISLDVFKRMKFVEDIPIYSDEYEIEYILPNLSREIEIIELEQRYVYGDQFKSYKSQLTEVQNLLLSLIYFEGLNEEEIAKRLSVPMVTVRQKILGIMETLYKLYTGKPAETISNKAILELIKLEPLGFLTAEERMLLMNLKENDPDFLWTELGVYQNLAALISSPIPEQPMPRNFDEDVMNIFTQILLQDGDVEYPIIPSEIPTAEPEILKTILQSKPVESVTEPTEAPLEIKSKETVKVDQKESSFQLKFREPDPTELNILRKLDRTEIKPKTAPILSRLDNETNLKEQKQSVSKPDVVINRIANSPKPKEIINQTLKESVPVQNKIDVAPALPVNNIVNDDPLIVIDEPAPVVKPVEEKSVSRLTPTSSIKIEDIIKKDLSPINRKNTLVENSKLNNPLFFRNPEQEQKKKDAKSVAIEPKKNEAELKTAVEKKEEIRFKQNQTPKDLRPTLAETEIQQKIVKAKNQEPEKFEIKIKTNEPPKEIKPNIAVQTKVTPEVVKKEDVVPEKSEIRFRKVETPSEVKKAVLPPIVAKNQDPLITDTSNREKLVEQKQVEDLKAKEEQPIKEVKVENEISPVSNKTVTLPPNNGKDLKAEDAKKLSSLFKTRERKVEDTPKKTTQPEIEKTPLKIRETNFNEDASKKEITQKTDPKIDEIKSVVENILKDKKLAGAVSVEEVISKLSIEKTDDRTDVVEDSQESKVLFKDFSYEEEMSKINKQSRKKVFVYAAIFVVLAVTGVFAYLNLQSEPVKVASDIKKVNSSVVVEQPVNLVASNENIETTTPENTKTEVLDEKKDSKTEEKNTKEGNVKLPPLPESLEKKESTYFALDQSNDLMVNQPKVNNQTAAAKTETTIPPKENKIKEEEPAFFVAVEEMPELIGGLKQLQTKIKYPEIAKRTGIEGKVFVKALVDENGNVISASTIKGIGAGCDEAAIDAVRNSKFTPGKQRGKNVKVEVTIPIVFKK